MKRLTLALSLLMAGLVIAADPPAVAPQDKVLVAFPPTPPAPPTPPVPQPDIDWTKLMALVMAAGTAIWTAYQEARHQFTNRTPQQIVDSALAAILAALQKQSVPTVNVQQPVKPTVFTQEEMQVAALAVEQFRNTQGSK